MPTGKNIKGALEEVFKDAEERNGNLRIVMLTNGNRVMLETMFPDKFDYVTLLNFFKAQHKFQPLPSLSLPIFFLYS